MAVPLYPDLFCYCHSYHIPYYYLSFVAVGSFAGYDDAHASVWPPALAVFSDSPGQRVWGTRLRGGDWHAKSYGHIRPSLYYFVKGYFDLNYFIFHFAFNILFIFIGATGSCSRMGLPEAQTRGGYGPGRT